MTKVKREYIYDVVARDNDMYPSKVTDWYWSGDDELVFCTNQYGHDTEHYEEREFIRQMANHFADIDPASDMVGFDIPTDSFVFTSKGEIASASIPRNPRIERAFIRLDFRVPNIDEKDFRNNGFSEPDEVKVRRANIEKYKPYFTLNVLKEVPERNIPVYHRGEPGSVYWVIPDTQMKRIEYTMWRRNQFAKVIDYGKIKVKRGHMEYEKRVEAYMDGILFTEDGRRIMLASDADPRKFPYSPAYAHVGHDSTEPTHAMSITYWE